MAAPQVEEDPDHEFPPSTADDPPLSGPRLIEVGIQGPGAHPSLWRRAWRDKILPAVVNFNPDLILVSAGFDAHRKDVINYRYTRGGVCCSLVSTYACRLVPYAEQCNARCAGSLVLVACNSAFYSLQTMQYDVQSQRLLHAGWLL